MRNAIRKYPRLNKLKGLMKENDITIDELSKAIGRATSTVSLANNGYTLYDSMDMKNIQRIINSKSSKHYTLDEIFLA